jgi:hypothetical protein
VDCRKLANLSLPEVKPAYGNCGAALSWIDRELAWISTRN